MLLITSPKFVRFSLSRVSSDSESASLGEGFLRVRAMASLVWYEVLRVMT